MNNPSPFPSKFAFYSLKQAAAELNIYLNRADIDESYLLYLAATGAISLSIAMSNQYKLKCHIYNFVNDQVIYMRKAQVNNYYKPNRERNLKPTRQIKNSDANYYFCIVKGVAHYVVDKVQSNKFLNVSDNTIQQLISSGRASQTVFNDIFIYDPCNEIRRKLDLYVEDIQQGRDAGIIGIEPILFEKLFSSLNEETQTKILKETPKFIKDLSVEMEEFIQYKFDSSFWNFGLVNSNALGDRVPFESFDHAVEFCDIEISQNDLFIVKPEFERIINKKFRKPEANNLVHAATGQGETKKRITKKARLPPALLEACKSLDLSLDSLTSEDKESIKQWFKNRIGYEDLAKEGTFRRNLYEYLEKRAVQKND